MMFGNTKQNAQDTNPPPAATMILNNLVHSESQVRVLVSPACIAVLDISLFYPLDSIHSDFREEAELHNNSVTLTTKAGVMFAHDDESPQSNKLRVATCCFS